MVPLADEGSMTVRALRRAKPAPSRRDLSDMPVIYRYRCPDIRGGPHLACRVLRTCRKSVSHARFSYVLGKVFTLTEPDGRLPSGKGGEAGQCGSGLRAGRAPGCGTGAPGRGPGAMARGTGCARHAVTSAPPAGRTTAWPLGGPLRTRREGRRATLLIRGLSPSYRGAPARPTPGLAAARAGIRGAARRAYRGRSVNKPPREWI
jgi:hypothetical protein